MSIRSQRSGRSGTVQRSPYGLDTEPTNSLAEDYFTNTPYLGPAAEDTGEVIEDDEEVLLPRPAVFLKNSPVIINCSSQTKKLTPYPNSIITSPSALRSRLKLGASTSATSTQL